MSSVSPAGCTVHPDGTLKDASEIKWFNDRDDETPLASSVSQVVSGAVAQVVHPFFSGQSASAAIVAGSCHFVHTSCLLCRLLDLKEAATVLKESSSWHSDTKCKAPTRGNICHVS